MGLVLGGPSLETTWRPLEDGGLFARKLTVGDGADIETELASLGADGTWADEGIALAGGAYVLMDALDLGETPERAPLAVNLPGGSYRVLSRHASTGRVSWICIRLAIA
jgi:hypothetical protein